MTPSTVTRFASMVAVFLITVAGLFAWWARGRDGRGMADTGASGADAGGPLFRTHCGTCHTLDEIRGVIRLAPDPQARVRELERFLERHGDASAEADRAILAFLKAGDRETAGR